MSENKEHEDRENELYAYRTQAARMLARCERPVPITFGIGDPVLRGHSACGQCDACVSFRSSVPYAAALAALESRPPVPVTPTPTEDDREANGGPIPHYAMLDIWMALHGTSHPEYDEFYAEHGYAETWARLCSEVRSRRLSSTPVETEENWEWGVIAEGDDEPYTDHYRSRQDLADDIGYAIGHESDVLVHRRPAGPWLPVTEEKK